MSQFQETKLFFFSHVQHVLSDIWNHVSSGCSLLSEIFEMRVLSSHVLNDALDDEEV